jgi:hypothetical protein
MNKIVLKLLVIFTCSTMLLLLLDSFYRKAYTDHYESPKNIFPNSEIDEKYTIVKLGNSHAQDGISFEGYKLKALNLSGVAQKFEMDLALLKQHSKEIDEGAVILIAVSPISFSHTAANSQKGFQAGYYGKVSPIFIPHINWGDYIERELMPFSHSVYSMRKKETEKIVKRDRLEREKLEPKKEVATPAAQLATGPVIVSAVKKPVKVLNVPPDKIFYNVEAITDELASASSPQKYIDNVDFIYNKWYHTDEFSPEYFDQNKKDLEQLIAFSLKQKWQPVLITIPVSDDLIDGLLDDYMQVYLYDNLNQVDKKGVEYIDFSNDKRITTNTALFSNADHLSKNGAAIFSYVLLRTLIEKGYISPEADGYNYDPLYVEVYQ